MYLSDLFFGWLCLLHHPGVNHHLALPFDCELPVVTMSVQSLCDPHHIDLSVLDSSIPHWQGYSPSRIQSIDWSVLSCGTSAAVALRSGCTVKSLSIRLQTAADLADHSGNVNS